MPRCVAALLAPQLRSTASFSIPNWNSPNLKSADLAVQRRSFPLFFLSGGGGGSKTQIMMSFRKAVTTNFPLICTDSCD